MTSQLEVVEATGVFGENHRLTPSHWQLSHIPRPGSNPGSKKVKDKKDKSKKHNIDVYKDLEIINIFHEKCNRSNEE